ncbi:hypothetical protein HDU92_005929 [Lobulomyces angularis]|nr:hypothetical protein HDU92_005929 [Lobulomyces angularis]
MAVVPKLNIVKNLTKRKVCIGLEIHATLKTKHKLFSNTINHSNINFKQNSNANLFDLGFPGSLPVINNEAVCQAIKVCYDLPLGYQITQKDHPIANYGFLDIMSGSKDFQSKVKKRISINQIQLEMDSAKSIQNNNYVYLDFNRSNQPVLEIVTDPTLESSDDTVSFLKLLLRELIHNELTITNIEQGTFRTDVNISLTDSLDKFGTRCEIKHLSSFNSIKQAIDFEIERQNNLLDNGVEVQHETRGFNEKTLETFLLREKEMDADYRFLPEPDLPIIEVSDRVIDTLRSELPESLQARRERLLSYGLSDYTVNVLMDQYKAVEFFEKCAKNRDKKKVANWMVGEIFRFLNENAAEATGLGDESSFNENQESVMSLSMNDLPISAERLGEVIDLVDSEQVSALRGKNILRKILREKLTETPLQIAKDLGYIQMKIDLEEFNAIFEKIAAENYKQIERLKGKKNAKKSLKGFFMGKFMSETKGKLNPLDCDKFLEEKLDQN